MPTPLSRAGAALIALSLLVLAIIATYSVTTRGPGISPDSVIYLVAAQNFNAGLGLVAEGPDNVLKPLEHFPPLYPVLLAHSIRLLTDDGLAVLALNFTALIVCALSLLAILNALHTRSLLIVVGFIAIIFSEATINSHIMMWSEPLFLAFIILFLAVGNTNSSSESWLRFSLSVLLATLAFMTRYAGIALVFTLLFEVLISKRQSPLRKALSLVGIALVTFTPLLVWKLSQAQTLSSVGARTVTWHPLAISDLHTFSQTIVSWINPTSIRLSNLAAGMFALLILILWGYCLLRTRARPISMPLRRSHIFGGMYLFTLLVAKQLFDAYVPFDSRILLPLLPVIVLSIVDLLGDAHARKHSPLLYTVTSLVLVAMVASSILHNPLADPDRWKSRLGYRTEQWLNSPTRALVETFPHDSYLASNGPDAIRALSGRRALQLPSAYIPTTRQPNPQFESELLRLASELAQRDGRIVYFNRITWRRYLPSPQELSRIIASQGFYLRLESMQRDGAIYAVTSTAPISNQQ